MDKWLWVDAATAVSLANSGDATLEILRKGHSFLNMQQFAALLGTGNFRIIVFKNRATALVELVDYENGILLNILTVHGDLRRCDVAMQYLEEAAKEAGANMVVSVGHTGWARIMKRRGYTLEPKLYMKKVLQ